MLQELGSDRRFKALVLLVLLLASIGIAAYTYLAYTQAKMMSGGMSSISVVGKAERFVRPDIATFTFSVVADAKDATTAQTNSAKAYNAILEYLKGKGVEEKDIKTEGYNLYPKYEYTNSVCNQWGVCPPGKQNLVGYTVDQSVSVKIRKIEEAGNLVGGVGDNGATNISGLVFTIDDVDGVRADVREEAIADAKEKADRLAKSLGIRLGKLINFSDNNQNVPMPMYNYGGMEKQAMAMDAAVAPDITPGENEVVSTVTLVFQIR